MSYFFNWFVCNLLEDLLTTQTPGLFMFWPSLPMHRSTQVQVMVAQWSHHSLSSLGFCTLMTCLWQPMTYCCPSSLFSFPEQHGNEIQLPESYSICQRTLEMERHWCTGMVPAMLGQLIGSIFLQIWCMPIWDSCSITWPVKMLAQDEESPEGYLRADTFSCICLAYAHLYSQTHSCICLINAYFYSSPHTLAHNLTPDIQTQGQGMINIMNMW